MSQRVTGILGRTRVFGNELWNGSPKTAKEEVLPVLSFFLEFYFSYGVF